MEKTDILKKFGFDDSVFEGAMVYRLEFLLAGVPFSALENIVNHNLDEYTKYCHGRIEKLKDALSSLPPPEEDAEYQAYLKDCELFNIEISAMTYDQKKRILDLFNHAVEDANSFSRVDKLSKRKIRSEEQFSYSALENDDLMASIQYRLMDIMDTPDRIFYEERILDFQRQIEENETDRISRLNLSINRDVFFEEYPRVISLLTTLRKQGKLVRLVIDDNGEKIEENNFETRIPYSYSDKELQILKETFSDDKFVDELYFSEFYEQKTYPFLAEDMWEYGEVEFVNSCKNDIIKDTELLGLTPLETCIHLFRYLSRMNYAGVATNDEKTRTFLTGEDTYIEEDEFELIKRGRAFTCGSAASYAKAFIDGLSSPNLKAQIVNMAYYSKETKEKRSDKPHIALILYVNDKNYGVENNYTIFDPAIFLGGGGLSGAFIPIHDMSNLDKFVVIGDGKNFSKVCNLIVTPRDDKMGDSWTYNGEYFRKFGSENSSFSFDVLVDIVKNYFTKLKSKEGYIDFEEEVKQSSPTELAENMINQSLKYMYKEENPYTAQAPLYKYTRQKFFEAKAKNEIDGETPIDKFVAKYKS